LLPFSATIASATICRRFRQLLSPVWTGYNSPSDIEQQVRTGQTDR